MRRLSGQISSTLMILKRASPEAHSLIGGTLDYVLVMSFHFVLSTISKITLAGD